MVDDDEEDYLITRSMLGEAQGRKVKLDWAPTCQACQELLHANHYDAVLIDYDLGLRTGIDLIRVTTAQGYSAPLILYTGRGSYEVDVEAMQAGATLYVTKTEATPLLLERSIRYAIERKRIEEERTTGLQALGYPGEHSGWLSRSIGRSPISTNVLHEMGI
jgi:DNA-binding NtrC family response regulator